MKEQRVEINTAACLDKDKMLSFLTKWKEAINIGNQTFPNLYNRGAILAINKMISNIEEGCFDKRETSVVVLAVKGCEVTNVIFPENKERS